MIATQSNPHQEPPPPLPQTRQLAPHTSSRDSLPSLEYEFPLSSTSRFPISSVREDEHQSSTAVPPAHPPKPIYPRHDPLHILSQLSPSRPPRVNPYVTPAPSVAPGILADGVLTAKLPSVRQFLEAATIAPPERPPFPTDKRVLALVALSVFYRPLHPAHWTFWNKEQRKETAQLVQSIMDITPTPILSPIGWIDVKDNLWILGYTQAAYAPLLASFPWYATYTPAEPENRMNLRKRKPKATANRASGEETVDEEDKVSPPPRKRARTRKSTTRPAGGRAKPRPSARNTPTGEGNNEGNQSGTPVGVQGALLLAPDVTPTLTKVAKREWIENSDPVISATVPEGSVQPDPPDVEQVPELRKSVRQRERRAKATNAASPASTESTLTPPVQARGLSQVTTSRESSAVTPESLGGAESGSSTAVSLCGEEGSKSKVPKTVEVVVGKEEDELEAPPAKKPRIARPRAKSGSRARTATKTDAVPNEATTITTAQARPKARSRAKTRRR